MAHLACLHHDPNKIHLFAGDALSSRSRFFFPGDTLILRGEHGRFSSAEFGGEVHCLFLGLKF